MLQLLRKRFSWELLGIKVKIPFKLRTYRCTEQLTLLSAKESYIFIRQISSDRYIILKKNITYWFIV